MAVLALILTPAYIVQFYLQQSVAYIEDYEKIDCDIYHDSISNYIYSEDVTSANLDSTTLSDYFVTSPASADSNSNTIPGYSGVKY